MAKRLEVPDHPDVARALRTGYPRQYDHLMCADCGSEMTGSNRVYISDGDTVCGTCLTRRILENYSIDDLAEAFDVRCTTVIEFKEGQEDA